MTMHHSGWGLFEFVLSALGLASLIAYWVAAFRLRSTGHHWSIWRLTSFSSGILLLFVGLLPGVASFAQHDLRGHMIQHLLLGMFAPLGLVFGAPISLTLRTARRNLARRLVAFLHLRPLRVIYHPFTAMILNVGGMYALYMTPLYEAMLRSAWLHALIHWHFLVAGCLFTWAIAGPDPAPHRPGYRNRLLILCFSMGAHAFLAKAMYAYGWPAGGSHTLEEIQRAAKIMYYGGDLAEILLAAALFWTWFANKTKPGEAQTAIQPEGC